MSDLRGDRTDEEKILVLFYAVQRTKENHAFIGDELNRRDFNETKQVLFIVCFAIAVNKVSFFQSLIIKDVILFGNGIVVIPDNFLDTKSSACLISRFLKSVINDRTDFN